MRVKILAILRIIFSHEFIVVADDGIAAKYYKKSNHNLIKAIAEECFQKLESAKEDK